MASPVALCRRSYYGRPTYGIRPEDIRPPDTCNNLIASCSARDVAHESHNWLSPGFWAAATEEELFGWRHCEGVSGLERRAAGASTPPATAPLLSSSCRDARESGNAVGVGQGDVRPLRQQRER